ncbi:MAG: Tfp pilus assembly protein PilF [Planctomycetota bacterium]|jgi:Tfp pilus assembly protein PilF
MSLTKLPVALLLGLILLSAGCVSPQPDNRYQQSNLSNNDDSSNAAVANLHKSALAAMAQQSYIEAAGILQRAIKIEPRNPLSWHYLAQNYWHSGDLARCGEMADRSFSYNANDDELDKANRFIKRQCLQE